MNIVDILSDKASKYPDRTAFIFLEDGESKEQKISFGELDKQARVIAALLQTMGLEEGSRVLIPLPSGPQSRQVAERVWQF